MILLCFIAAAGTVAAPEHKVVCSGVLGWAVANCILACSESVTMICAFRVFNGLCLGMVLPVVQSQRLKPHVISGHVDPL